MKIARRSMTAVSRLVQALAVSCAMASTATAQLIRDTPLPETEGVGIIDRAGATIQPDLTFRDSEGRDLRIGDVFDGKRPVMLIMAYYDCPLLCTLVLNGVQEAINDVSLSLGEDYRIVTVSFDHTDTTSMAAAKKAMYTLGYNREIPDDAWIFCTSEPEAARELARAVGFRYKFLPESGEFSHPSGVFFLTPKGVLSGFIENIKFRPMDVKLALMNAADGRLGSLFDRVEFTCYMYDPKTGQYRVQPMTVMRLVGGVTVLALGGTIGFLAWSNAVRRHRRPAATTPASTTEIGGER